MITMRMVGSNMRVPPPILRLQFSPTDTGLAFCPLFARVSILRISAMTLALALALNMNLALKAPCDTDRGRATGDILGKEIRRPPPPCLCLPGYKELVNESKIEIPEAIEPETVKNPHS